MPPTNPAPGPNPPGNYPNVPTPPAPPDPNAPPEWAKSLISTVGELKSGYDQLNELIMAEPDPGGGYEPNPPSPVPAPAPTADPYAGWKPNDWSDVNKEAEKIAGRIVEEKLSARDQAAQAAQAQADAARSQVDRELDAAEQRLQQSGFLPPIADPNNPEDPGRAAKRELYAVATSLNTTDLDGVARQVKAMHDAGMSYDMRTNQWLRSNPVAPGSFAPVGSSGATRPGSATPVSYEQIHKASSLQTLAASRGLQ